MACTGIIHCNVNDLSFEIVIQQIGYVNSANKSFIKHILDITLDVFCAWEAASVYYRKNTLQQRTIWTVVLYMVGIFLYIVIARPLDANSALIVAIQRPV